MEVAFCAGDFLPLWCWGSLLLFWVIAFLSGGVQKLSQKVSGISGNVSNYFRNVITIGKSTNLLLAIYFSVLCSFWDHSLQQKTKLPFLVSLKFFAGDWAFFPLVQTLLLVNSTGKP